MKKIAAKKMWCGNFRVGAILFASLLLLTASANIGLAQQTPVAEQTSANHEPNDYAIGTGDVLSVTVSDAQEFGGKFRVSDAGTIDVPGVATPIVADGQTAASLAKTIRQALVDAKQLRDPKVTVFVEEFHGRTITVLGAVTKPAVYPIQRHTRVLDALSLAGGALPGAGNTVTVVRGPASAEATNTAIGSVQIIDMGRLLSGGDLSTNIEVKNGDVVSVSAAQVIYVLGAVQKPGGYTMTNPSAGISVVQAVALASGFSSVAASHRGLVVRQSTSEIGRQEIVVDIAKMQIGQSTDLLLAPNDVLFIPDSGTKKALKVMGDIALAAVNGAAIYGVGYRVGGIK